MRALLVVSAIYGPLAINYMWWAFGGDAPRWQNDFTALFTGDDYVAGAGSVDSVRALDYSEHRLVMLVHTVLGGMALLLMIPQLSARVRRRSLALHRWTGRAYMALMTVSMTTAIAFVFLTPPTAYRSGQAFELQLWALAFGTLGSAWIAVRMARTRNIAAHRAWMQFNFALMLTAPLLRVGWTALAPLFPDRDLLTNLDATAVTLAVLAPGGGAIAFMTTLARTHRPTAPLPLPTRALIVAVLTFTCGEVLAVANFARFLDQGATVSYLLFHMVPAAGLLLVCAIGTARAAGRGDAVRLRAWRTLLIGASLVPTGTVVTAVVASIPFTPFGGVMAGFMVGPTGAIAAGFAVAVATATQRQRRQGRSRMTLSS